MDTVLKVFTSMGLSLGKLCGIATDGASVMIGCRNGVTTQLKKKILNSLYNSSAGSG